MSLSVTNRARESLPDCLSESRSGRKFGVCSEALRCIAEMERQGRLAPFGKGLEPAEPAGKISGREHFRKDDIIAPDVCGRDSPKQIQLEATLCKNFQDIESKPRT